MDGSPNVNAETIASTLPRGARRSSIATSARCHARAADQTIVTCRSTPASSSASPNTGARCRPRRPPWARATATCVPCPATLMRALARPSQRTDPAAGGTFRIGDIDLIARSLSAHRGVHAGWFAVRRLLWRVRTFGFHLARLDVRQDSRVHAQALAVALDDEQWDARDAAAQAGTLRPYASGDLELPEPSDAAGIALDAVFDQLAFARDSYGGDATGAHHHMAAAADVLGVLALARRAEFVDADGNVPLGNRAAVRNSRVTCAWRTDLVGAAGRSDYREHLAARRSADGHARLFRRQQGYGSSSPRRRRLRTGRSARCRPRRRHPHRVLPWSRRHRRRGGGGARADHRIAARLGRRPPATPSGASRPPQVRHPLARVAARSNRPSAPLTPARAARAPGRRNRLARPHF